MRASLLAALAGVVVVALGAAPVACGSAFSSAGGTAGDGGSDGSMTPDAPGAEGSSGDDAAGDTGVADGGDAATGHIVYVSPAGDDLATGLDPAHPKKTITAGLVAAKPLGGLPQVHVCAGTYSEDAIDVTFDVVLDGAYDCTTWMRTATYGYPHPDGVNTSLIASPDTTVQEAALVLAGNVTKATVVDGFAITGATTSAARTDGVHVTGSASPILSNDSIAGGGGQAAASTGNTGSVGILVDMQAAPEIEDCFVSGGDGRGTVGSTGVELDSTGGVNLNNAVITGGTGQSVVSGTSGTAAIGVDVRTPLTTPLTSLIVSGTDAAGTSGPTVGVRFAGASVAATLAASYIEGGVGLDSTAAGIGVLIDTPGGGITLTADRVYGGQRTVGTMQETYGIFVVAAGSLTVEDSLVHAGTVQSGGVAGVASYAGGIVLSAVAAPVLVFDTVYTGSAQGVAVSLGTGVTGAVIRDDLLLGSDSNTLSVGVSTSTCGGFIASLDHTAFGNLQTLYECNTGASTGSTSATNLTELLLDLSSAESNNVDVQGSCVAGDTSCAKFMGCPGASATCLPAIFGVTWSMDDGVSALFGSSAADGGMPITGWSLVPGAPCSIASGGTKYGSVTADAYGVTRNATTPTIGAVEYVATEKCSTN
ncbi:MAG: hypothetical protein ABSE49_33165 [Polyangiaceae bacterium]|jgi:hypothetical protein